MLSFYVLYSSKICVIWKGLCHLADSNITKRALAEALKELLKAEPFAQVSVGEICEKCHMNRKSFYYHFKDKYDLVNWIYSDDGGALDFYVVFYTDAFVCAIRRWILQKDCIPAEEFVRRLKRCLIGLSQRVMEKIQSREPTA